MRLWIVGLLALLVAGAPAAAEEPAWAALRADAVALFRHAEAPGVGDPAGMRLGDCTTQRNLDEAGRAQARRIGAAFRDRRVTVGAVLSSQWCRTLETAELAFPGRARAEPVFNSFFDDGRDGPARTQEGRRLLDGWQGPGALVIVTHQVNITALTGIWPRSGEGVVLQRRGGSWQVVGTIQP